MRRLFHCISAIFLCFNTDPCAARDCGTHGVIYPIEEEDPIVLIQQKLKAMEERGELKLHNIELQKKTKVAIERPKPVEGMTRASEARVFYYDPTYVVKEDLKDHTGRVFYKKGTKINPLETISLSKGLLFFDGDDPDQKAWAQGEIQKGLVKLILVKGEPLVLSEEMNVPVYFDQGGFLTKKLGIRHVPSLVTQERLRLCIEEIQLNGKSHTRNLLPKESAPAERDS
ncbi:MAG TPA: type-F conjugative transfer system protein TraW [Alphaproteobacteria bacterium]|nr:type-F conjugative transfer system protein TraW [Alphaproteobacteria bacterium]